MIRTLYERFWCSPVLGIVIIALLAVVAVSAWPFVKAVIECIGGLLWWSFGPAVPW